MELISLKDDLIINGMYSLLYQEKGVDFIFPGETHEFWELLYMNKGFAYLLIDDKGYKVTQGELFLFAKNQNHVLWSDSSVSPCFFTLSFNMVFHDEKYFEHKRFKANDDVKEIIKKIISERALIFTEDLNTNIGRKKDDPGSGAEQLIKMYIAELIIKLYRLQNVKENNINLLIIRKKSENVILSKCLDYINAHINEKLYLEQISGIIPVSSSHLNKIFNKYTGFSVMEYVNEIKLEKAKSLIRERSMSITEISYNLGFSSVHYFSRLFKRKHNISPREFTMSITSHL